MSNKTILVYYYQYQYKIKLYSKDLLYEFVIWKARTAHHKLTNNDEDQ